jgi:AraC-like DNA-binding protein
MTRAERMAQVSPAGSWEMVSREPHPALRRYVRRYVGYTERTSIPVPRVEFPGPQVVVIFEFGPPVSIFMRPDSPAAARYPGGFVAGIDDGPTVVAHDGYQRGLQLDLTPIGAHRLFGLPMSDIARRVLPLADVWPRNQHDLCDRLRDAPDWDARFDLLDRIVGARAVDSYRATDAIEWAVERIERSAGAVPMRTLARELGYSQKHVIQLFRDQVGVPPKLLARIIRFDRLVQHLRSGRAGSWADLALEVGYYDQAHLVRDVRQFTGLKPTNVRAMLLSFGAQPEVNSVQEDASLTA